MRAEPVAISQLKIEGCRLTAGFHLSEDQQAIRTLQSLEKRSDLLGKLCLGRGIFRGGIFKKVESKDAAYGRPYVSARDLEQVFIKPSSYLSYRLGRLLNQLELKERMILVTCSGMNLGSTIWTRADMAGLCASGDLIRIEIDEKNVPAGYVYAFLAGRFGRAAIRRNIYGGNIKHIDPSHIQFLRIPRLSYEMESEVNTLVQEASALRTKAADTFRKVQKVFDGVRQERSVESSTPRVMMISARGMQERLDAHHYDPSAQSIRAQISKSAHVKLGDICRRIFLPGIFKRIHIEDEQLGAPYYTGASLFRLDPRPKGVLSRRTSLFKDVQLEEGMILIQAFGQEGGLTGRAMWVNKHFHGATTTHMLARLLIDDRQLAFYVFGFLQSQIAYTQIATLPYGGSIPHLDESGLSTILMPLFSGEENAAIGTAVAEAISAQETALTLDRKARHLVEHAIEEAV